MHFNIHKILKEEIRRDTEAKICKGNIGHRANKQFDVAF